MAGKEAALAMVEELGRSERVRRRALEVSRSLSRSLLEREGDASQATSSPTAKDKVKDVIVALRHFLINDLCTQERQPLSSCSDLTGTTECSVDDKSRLQSIRPPSELTDGSDESGELVAAMRVNSAWSKLEPSHVSLLLSSSKRIRFAPHDPIIDTRNRRLGPFFLVVTGEVAVISRNVSGTARQDCQVEDGDEQYKVIGQGSTFGSCSAVASGETLGLDSEAMKEAMRFSYAVKAWGKTAGVVRQFDRTRFARSVALLLLDVHKRLGESLATSIPVFSSLSHTSLLQLAFIATRRSVSRSCPALLSQVAANNLIVIEEGSAWISARAQDTNMDVRLVRVAAGQAVLLSLFTSDALQLTMSESTEISFLAIPVKKVEKKMVLENMKDTMMVRCHTLAFVCFSDRKLVIFLFCSGRNLKKRKTIDGHGRDL